MEFIRHFFCFNFHVKTSKVLGIFFVFTANQLCYLHYVRRMCIRMILTYLRILNLIIQFILQNPIGLVIHPFRKE